MCLHRLRDGYFENTVPALRLDVLGVGGVGQGKAAEKPAGDALHALQPRILAPRFLDALARDAQYARIHADLYVSRIDAWNIRERDNWGRTKELKEAGEQAIEIARAAGAMISFDVNYRPRDMTADELRDGSHRLWARIGPGPSLVSICRVQLIMLISTLGGTVMAAEVSPIG